MRDADRYFETEWPAVARRLGWLLERHGVPARDRDDVIQETALRLLRAWPTLDEERGVEPYARTVALNLVRDAARRVVARAEVLVDVPADVPDAGDVVERTTLARMELGRVSRVLPRLRPAQLDVLRAAVAAELGEPAVAPVVPAAVRMARMRARRQLVALLGTASAWLAGAVALLRAAWRHSHPQRLALTATAVAVAVVFGHGTPAPRVVRVVPVGPGEAISAGRPAVVSPPVGAAARRRVGAVTPVPVRRAHPAAPRPAQVVDLPVAQVNVLAEFSGAGFHVQVRDRGDDLPVCARTPVGPTVAQLACAS